MVPTTLGSHALSQLGVDRKYGDTTGSITRYLRLEVDKIVVASLYNKGDRKTVLEIDFEQANGAPNTASKRATQLAIEAAKIETKKPAKPRAKKAAAATPPKEKAAPKKKAAAAPKKKKEEKEDKMVEDDKVEVEDDTGDADDEDEDELVDADSGEEEEEEEEESAPKSDAVAAPPSVDAIMV